MREWFNARSVRIGVVIVAVTGFNAGSVLASNTKSRSTQKAATETKQSDIRALEVGRGVEREMKGGEEHLYSIAIESGQYLDAVVEQRGIDVEVTVLTPDGKELFKVDSPNGT
ncbi:MAG TPA: hypothetical protein VKN18_29135, partial [Blastocatellia bacterium]|nr:hypothetical protein [Blastocatellia bacterium]